MKRSLVVALALFCAISVWPMSASEFFVAPDMLAARLSPDGKSVAAIVGIDADQALVVIDTDSGERRTLLEVAQFSENDAALLSATWLDDATIAALFSEIRTGVKDLLDTRRNRYLLVIRVPSDTTAAPEVLSVRTSGTLVDPLPDAPGEFLYAKSGLLSRVYRLNVNGLGGYKAKLSRMSKIDGGQFVRSNEVAQVDGYALRWFMAPGGQPRAVLGFNERAFTLMAFEGVDATRELKRWDAQSLADDDEGLRLLPIEAADGVDRFYCLDVNAETQNSIYLMDYAADEYELIYTSSENDIVELILSQTDNRLVGVSVLEDGQLRHTYFDPEVQAAQSATDSSTLRTNISQSRAGDRTLSYMETHNQPGQFWLTSTSGVRRLLGGRSPHLDGRLSGKLVEGQVSVEGLSIPYLLTLPKSSAPAPLVVMPHGGPIDVFDTRYFDETTQFLTARGYAVLRVNFRGSGGYSKAFMEAGKREYGGLMLTDIHAAAREAMARPDIDAGRVAVFGASYGGYAATMLAIEHPQVYRCAVTVAGLADINLFLGHTDFTERQQDWAREYIGDTVNDYDMLKSISPISRIDRLQRPIFVMHGALDDVVDIEHAYRLRHWLDWHQKTYDWFVFKDGTHSFSTVEQVVELHDKVVTYLDRQLSL
ncbi:MAG: alpha/beta hydrolase family protein [Gammaproteobacteria bacterium]